MLDKTKVKIGEDIEFQHPDTRSPHLEASTREKPHPFAETINRPTSDQDLPLHLWTLPDRSICLTAVRFPGGHFRGKTLSFNPSRVLYGHNAKVLGTSDELHLSLTRLVYLLGRLVGPSVANQILPGLEGSGSYYSSLEIPIQFDDLGQGLVNRCSFLKCPSIRKPPLVVPHESVTLRGSLLEIAIYNKSQQMKCGGAEQIIRFEGRLKKDLPRWFGQSKNGPFRLTSFGMSDLYGVLTELIGEMTGDLGSYSVGKTEIPKLVRFIHDHYGSCSQNEHEMLERWFAISPASKATEARYRKGLSELILSDVKAPNLAHFLPSSFSESAQCEGEKIKKFETEYRRFCFHWNLPIEPRPDIEATYSGLSFITPISVGK